MIQEKRNNHDLFLNCYNKRHQTNTTINQSDTGIMRSNFLIQNMISELYRYTDNVGEIHTNYIETDSVTEHCTNNDTDIDIDSYTGSGSYADVDNVVDNDSDSDNFVDTYNEPVIMEQCRLLCLGCYSGDLITVQILLKHFNSDALNNTVWPSTAFYFEKNPLIIACKYGYLDIVLKLLEAGADINICDGIETPLIAACKSGQHSIVRELLKSGASVNKQIYSYSPLQCACQEGHTLVVEELIKAEVDVKLNNIPLITACKQGHLSIVEKLIKAGADINPILTFESPLLAACEMGHFSVVKVLISAGADVNKEKKHIR